MIDRCEDNKEGNEEDARPRKKSVTWEDEESTSSSTGNSSGEDWDTDGEEQRLGSVIHFSHTTQPVTQSHSKCTLHLFLPYYTGAILLVI